MNYNYLVPSCETLVNGQKRKLYGKNKNKVYLNDGDEFQLKIFNPFSDRIGFQLKMNGSESDNSILVVNPGQSVIVERFIGTNRKLKFGTYLVDKNNPLTKGAIKDNGKLDIIFWNECKPVNINIPYISPITINPYPYNPCSPPVTPYPLPPAIPYPYYTQPSWDNLNICDSNISNSNFTNLDSGSFYSTTNGVDIKGDLNVSGNIRAAGLNLNESLSETGRIEKGNRSNQHFSQTEFTCGTIIKTYSFKLLPFSEKKKEEVVQSPYQSNPYVNNTSYVKSEGRDYCPNKRCNYRVRKNNWGFCPLCGTKLD